MAFNWDFDMGGAGFGRADYAEALRRGGGETLDRKALEETRQAVKKWMEAPGTGQSIGSKIKDWVSSGTGIGSTMYGRKGQDELETKVYGKADLWADIAQGRSFADIEEHFTDDPRNLAKIDTSGDAFKILSQAARDERRREARSPLEKKISTLTGNVSTLESAVKTAKEEGETAAANIQADLTKALKSKSDLETDLESVGKDLATSQAAYKALDTEYKDEVAALKSKAAMTRSSAPVSVTSPSPLSIRFAQGPKRTGFRGTLAGLTRPVAASNKLKSTSLNV
tara:strand:- start:130 stop:978 length:849 start_codon:yes stop_codon:yes gene_type:complete